MTNSIISILALFLSICACCGVLLNARKLDIVFDIIQLNDLRDKIKELREEKIDDRTGKIM